MPADYELLTVHPGDQWNNDYGTFQSYELLLKGLDAPGYSVKLNRKLVSGAVPQDKVPQVGQTLYLQLDGKKAKQVQKDDQGSSNGAGGGKPDEAYWEARNASIVRQHSQEMALRFVQSCGGLPAGAFQIEDLAGEALLQIKRLTDWFEKDAQREQKAPETAPPKQEEPPAADQSQFGEDLPF